MTQAGIYEIYPVAFSRQLKNRGRNDMRAAFLLYWDDYCDSDVKSARYYSNTWTSTKTKSKASSKHAGMSPDTARLWMKEFDKVIERFESARDLFKRMADTAVDSFDKKQIGQIGQSESVSSNVSETSVSRETDELANSLIGQIGQGKSEQVLSINNNTACEEHVFDGEFNYLFTTCRFTNSNLGGRKTAHESYIDMKKRSNISIADLSASYSLYMMDHKTHSGMPYGLAKFLDNDLYISYSYPYIKLKTANGEIEGWYSRDHNELELEDGSKQKLTVETFNKLLQRGDVEVLPQMKAKVS